MLSPKQQLKFKDDSLEALAQQLSQQVYPGYPKHQNRLVCEDLAEAPRLEIRKPGPWWTDSSHEEVSESNLHPWFDEMVRNRAIGVVAGLGFYWEVEANKTADPVVIRNDLGEAHVLLIRRKDIGKLALPGGFVDAEDNSSIDAAVREAGEEALIDLRDLSPAVTPFYSGPVADIRTTAHAWAETTAVRFVLPEKTAEDLPVGPYEGGDDASMAIWTPKSQLDDNLFGSHRLLVDLAFKL
jgi:ADP-ribose pyrophosphatase YjhB (NUDIX family)